MKPNTECHLCGLPIFRKEATRTVFDPKKDQSQYFYCSLDHKNMSRGNYNLLYSIPKDNPIFQATTKAYHLPVARYNDKTEYITNITICNFKKYMKEGFAPGFYVIGTARVNDIPNLCGKTPTNMGAVRHCFDGITISDIEKLSEIQDLMETYDQDWKSIQLKWWNEEDVTYELRPY